jgi:hypothetical protein
LVQVARLQRRVLTAVSLVLLHWVVVVAVLMLMRQQRVVVAAVVETVKQVRREQQIKDFQAVLVRHHLLFVAVVVAVLES